MILIRRHQSFTLKLNRFIPSLTAAAAATQLIHSLPLALDLPHPSRSFASSSSNSSSTDSLMSRHSLVDFALSNTEFQCFQHNPLKKLHLHRNREKENFDYIHHSAARFIPFSPMGIRPAMIKQIKNNNQINQSNQLPIESILNGSTIYSPAFFTLSQLMDYSTGLLKFPMDPNYEIDENQEKSPGIKGKSVEKSSSNVADEKISEESINQTGFIEPIMLGIGNSNWFNQFPLEFIRLNNSNEQSINNNSDSLTPATTANRLIRINEQIKELELNNPNNEKSLHSSLINDHEEFIYFAFLIPTTITTTTNNIKDKENKSFNIMELLMNRLNNELKQNKYFLNEFTNNNKKLSQDDKLSSYEYKFEFSDLRSILPYLHIYSASILAQSRALLEWHSNARSCGRCGSPTIVNGGGSKRVCLGCFKTQYPRTDSVTIALISDASNSRVLLGRKKEFPPGVYSCLAGFLEGGETIAEAVQREIFEESGVLVESNSVRYFQSQPWPFLGGQLMIGCFGRVAAGFDERLVKPQDDELESVKFFSRQEIGEMLNISRTRSDLWILPRGVSSSSAVSNGELPTRIPPPFAIAHQLIQQWYTDTANETNNSKSDKFMVS